MTIPSCATKAQYDICKLLESLELPLDLCCLIVSSVLKNQKFLTWPASNKKHHVYSGGLIVHTAEVLRYAMAAAGAILDKVDTTVLAVAVVYHDFAKIQDYEWSEVWAADMDGQNLQEGSWVQTPYRRLVRHVSGSHAHFVNTCGTCESLTSTQFLNIEHCILSHHGRQEWGSPVEPATVEAHLLHNADLLSALFGDGKNSTGL